jgi:hypothetical protein
MTAAIRFVAFAGLAQVSGCQWANLGGDLGRDIGNMLGRDNGFSRGGQYGSKVGSWRESKFFTSLGAREGAELSIAIQRAAESGKSESWGSKGSSTAQAALPPNRRLRRRSLPYCRTIRDIVGRPRRDEESARLQAGKRLVDDQAGGLGRHSPGIGVREWYSKRRWS